MRDIALHPLIQCPAGRFILWLPEELGLVAPVQGIRSQTRSHLVASVRLQLLVVGVLDEDRDVADVRRHRDVVVHHGDCRFLCAHLQERLGNTNDVLQNGSTYHTQHFNLACGKT